MKYEERKKFLDKYFENITREELEKILVECGVDEITSPEDEGYTLLGIRDCSTATKPESLKNTD